MKSNITFWIFFFLSIPFINAQQNAIELTAVLDTTNHLLKIQQKTVYHNTSQDTLHRVLFHNWANSFKDDNTPLAKRFLDDYNKRFYFSKEDERGYSNIHNILVNYEQVVFKNKTKHPDIVQVDLNYPLPPKDSISVYASYTVKIPSVKFTGYGKTRTGYHLRFWYLTPVVYDEKWQTMSNLNMDDLYQDVARISIEMNVPKNYTVESNLEQDYVLKENSIIYRLMGKKKKDVILHIDTVGRFKSFQTEGLCVKTDIFDRKIDVSKTTAILHREITFIESYLGKHPHPEILVDAHTVNKSSFQEIYDVPDWLTPYPEDFRWEMRFLKALTLKYVDDVLLLNPRTDYWLNEGIKTFLVMKYIETYYPDVNILGKYGNLWGVKSYNLAQLKQHNKFSYLYQFSARKFYDQPLNTPAEKLSNFNRKVISPYKAGLGLQYLQGFLGDSILRTALKEFYKKENLKITKSHSFERLLRSHTTKNVDWFFGDYIQTNKKIDYTITQVKTSKYSDSLDVTLKNKRQMTAPVILQGIKDKKVTFKTWVTGVDSTKTVTIKKGNFKKLALNYRQVYPEYNALDNFSDINNKLFQKPLQFRFLKDIENPYYTQIFYNPSINYNLYNGVIVGVNFNNQPILSHNLRLSITPNFATKSKSLTGGFSIGYNHYLPNSKKLYKLVYGLSGSHYHYDRNLAYQTFYPYFNIQFKRNSLRDVGLKTLNSRLIHVNKEVSENRVKEERDQYTVANIRYIFSKPNVIKSFQYALNLELANNFSKFSTDVRYREFFDLDKRFNLRFFGGFFFYNNSHGNYFSFGLNRGSDYLFEHNLFGRSENSGLFNQQFILSDAGFKSFFNQNSYANQMMLSGNSNVTIWKWLEVYNDVALLKNQNLQPAFFYENGIRLNFVSNIFEFYLPIYTNEGWQINQPKYATKIRFVITTNVDRIYNFLRRGIL